MHNAHALALAHYSLAAAGLITRPGPATALTTPPLPVTSVAVAGDGYASDRLIGSKNQDQGPVFFLKYWFIVLSEIIFLLQTNSKHD